MNAGESPESFSLFKSFSDAGKKKFLLDSAHKRRLMWNDCKVREPETRAEISCRISRRFLPRPFIP
jgi:hypothetical protein